MCNGVPGRAQRCKRMFADRRIRGWASYDWGVPDRGSTGYRIGTSENALTPKFAEKTFHALR